MSINTTLEKLREMRMTTMADVLVVQKDDPSFLGLNFDERLALLVDAEHTSRRNNKRHRLIGQANFDQPGASISNINFDPSRQLNRDLINQLATGQYILDASNIILLGASGSGKSYLACAFGMEACKHYHRVKYIRLPDLLVELAIARETNTYHKVMKSNSKYHLLIIDEWMLISLRESEARDVLEIVHIRHKKASTIFCSQFTPVGWHTKIGEATLAEAILDRIVHDSYTIQIHSAKGDKSMREIYGIKSE